MPSNFSVRPSRGACGVIRERGQSLECAAGAATQSLDSHHCERRKTAGALERTISEPIPLRTDEATR